MIRLHSTNPKFSWILRKNPETQRTKNEPFSKALRKGNAFGWFTDDQTFKMMFQDSPTESSFNTISDFEYLDRTRYSSPYLPIAMIGALLASALKDETEEDSTGFTHHLRFIVEFPDVRLATKVSKIMPCTIALMPLGKHLFQVDMVTDQSIRFLLNCAISYLIVQAVIDPNLYVLMDEESVKKYINAMNVIDAPYYVRYIMAMKCIKSPNIFESIKPSLENGKYSMNFGDTQNHRYMAIDKQLTGGKELFDIGCGELYYSKRMTKRYEVIHAFDADDDICASNNHFVKIRGLENIKIDGAYDHNSIVPSSKNSDVLITEVMEHMPQEDAIAILDRIVRHGVFNKIVITVPNKDFNVYYGMGEIDIRHLDHHWEPTEAEFKELIEGFASDFPHVEVQYFDVGDAVIVDEKKIHSTLGCVLEMKEVVNE